MNVHLRRASNSDRRDIERLHIEGLKQTGAFALDPSLDADLLDVEANYLLSGGDFVLAEIADDIVGMGAFRKVNDVKVEVKRMRVTQVYQRQGIGAAVLAELIERIKVAGYREIVLDTAKTQTAAQKLYERFGFRHVRDGMIAEIPSRFYKLNVGR